MFFTWIRPFVERTHKSAQLIAYEDCGTLRDKDRLGDEGTTLKANYAKQVAKNSSTPLLSALVQTMHRTLLIVFVSELILCLNGCMHGFQARYVIEYISASGETSRGLTSYGLFLITWQCLVVIFERLGNSHKDRVKQGSGERAKNICREIVFDKMTTYSLQANKDLGEGELLALISTDCNKAEQIFHYVAAFCHMLLNTTLTFCYLTYYFGWAFIVITLVGVSIWFLLQKAIQQKKDMHKEKNKIVDRKNNLISEVLNNIKTLKLYGWQQEFQKRIFDTHDEEIAKTQDIKMSDIKWGAFGFFMFALIPILIFATHVYLGNSLDLPTVLITMQYLKRLSWGIGQIPNLYNQSFDIRESFNKIHRFL